MIIDNVHILPISNRNLPYPQMMEAMKELTAEHPCYDSVTATTDLGIIKINKKLKTVFLKQRRYDVVEEYIWRLECGSMIACFEELGYTFYYEPGISN